MKIALPHSADPSQKCRLCRCCVEGFALFPENYKGHDQRDDTFHLGQSVLSLSMIPRCGWMRLPSSSTGRIALVGSASRGSVALHAVLIMDGELLLVRVYLTSNGQVTWRLLADAHPNPTLGWQRAAHPLRIYFPRGRLLASHPRGWEGC